MRESFALPFLFPLGIASVVVQYGRILHYFREMSQKLALGDAINHRKPLARPNQAPSGDTVDHRRHGRSLRGRHIPLWHSQSASASGARLSLCHGVGLVCRRVMPISGSRRTSPSSDGRILSFPRICSGWRTEPSPPRMGTCQVGFRLQYTRTAFLSAAQWCFQTAWKDLIAQGRVHAESLALPGLDQAKLVQDAFGSCLLLRQGTQVWRVSLNHMEDGVWPPCLVAGGRAPVPGDHSSCLIFWMAFFSRREICAWEMPMWAETSIWVFPQRSAGGGWFSPGR